MSFNGRSSGARAILGSKLFNRLIVTKVLLVGAGGIGCELLKDLVLTGFGHITLLDLDTIDLSNLNRQFLFRKKDVKQSKALVAAQTAGAFNPNVHIHPIHANIKEPQFDVEWFQQFDIVMNALDNLDARRHVNKMCLAAQIPLVESGTAGYLGQVQPMIKDAAECFDCVPKPTPKTFPVCTIRSTPSQPIHCIVWAKSYLCSQLFGEDENAVGELDEAEKHGENAQEIAALRKEALAFQAVRSALRSKDATDKCAARMAFQKVFHSDILNLLSMADMWRTRDPPIPLDFEKILDGSFILRPPPVPQAPSDASSSQTPSSDAIINGTKPSVNGNYHTASNLAGSNLKDQKRLTLKDNLELFIASSTHLAARLRAGEDTIAFDKDDDDTLDFVTAASNLRSFAYGIESKTRWEVKEMAGNIIPAIATTNAVIAGIIVLQGLHLLRKSYNSLKNVHIQLKPSVPLSAVAISQPNPHCGVCRDCYTTVQCDPTRTKLGDLVNGILGVDDEEEPGREVSVYEDKRILSDPDWRDNYERTLESLNVRRCQFLNIVDEDGELETISVAIAMLPPNHLNTLPPFILPSPLPQPPRRVPRPPPPPASPPLASPPRIALKRRAPEDDIIDLKPSPKRAKEREDDDASNSAKKQRPDADGLVLIDGGNDEVIEID